MAEGIRVTNNLAASAVIAAALSAFGPLSDDIELYYYQTVITDFGDGAEGEE